MKELLCLINSKEESSLQEQLKEGYNAEAHRFQLTLRALNDHCKLIKGSKLFCSFSNNLVHLLGFPIEELELEETQRTRG